MVAIAAEGLERGGHQPVEEVIRLRPNVSVQAGVRGVFFARQAVGQEGPGQALGDEGRIVVQDGEKFLKHLR